LFNPFLQLEIKRITAITTHHSGKPGETRLELITDALLQRCAYITTFLFYTDIFCNKTKTAS
jgi:hypothetical protein